MNIIKPQLNQSRREHSTRLRKICNFCVYAGCLILFVCHTSLTLSAEETEATENSETQTTENTGQAAAPAENTGAPVETGKETITGTAIRMERYDKEGITILIGEAKTVRYDEQGVEIGFLNADKITMKSDPETDTTTEIIAEGNVEIRDQEIFATCDHAIMNNLTNIITLKENVVVLQNKDRLETKLFTFNRTTGKQTGEGGVKFKVTVTQVAPVATEGTEDTENAAETGEEETSAPASAETEDQTQTDTDTETGNAEADAEEKVEEEPDTDTENADDEDSEEEPDTDTENPDDADSNTETEESEDD